MLEIIYQSHDLIAVNKPAGLVVHRGWANDSLTVADIVRDEIIKAPVHAIHRLDRGTSGVMLFACNPDLAAYLQAQMDAGRFLKKYIALVRGPMKENCRVDNPVPKEKSKQSPRLPASTVFTIISHKDRWTLVRAEPQTGRLHQIRRHLKHISHPIVGDVRYGKGEINRFFRHEYGLGRMALHASELEISLPDGIRLLLRAALPDDLSEPLRKLGIEVPAHLTTA